jgi:hypothetical protein
MAGLNGVELINCTKEYLSEQGVSPEDMPKFAFRAAQFWELSAETIQ